MQFDKENIQTVEKLKSGKTCLVQGFGQSMTPILKSGQVCKVVPVFPIFLEYLSFLSISSFLFKR